MECKEIHLPFSNRFIEDYIGNNPNAMQFLGGDPNHLDSYRQRIHYLSNQNFPFRMALSTGLVTYNKTIGNHSQAIENARALQNEDVYVVVGGQQAGVMTGPLYTIHKAVHLIQAAKDLTQRLKVQVVPVFWIAGEDHDLDEVDHLYAHKDNSLVKVKLKGKGKPKKQSISMLSLEEGQMLQLVEEFLMGYGESPQMNEIRQLLTSTVEGSTTVVHWFEKLMVHLFGKHGLVLIESSSPFLRELEAPLFEKVIQQNDEIRDHLLNAEDRLRKAGYPTQLQLDPNQAHFFLYEKGERFAVEREGNLFRTKGGKGVYTKEELLGRLVDEPTAFSTNVVTRPLMQESLLPTLAFIGGAGELAYWAYFKDYFAHMGIEMPVCIPRASFTILEPTIHRYITKLGGDVEQVMMNFPQWKEDVLHALTDEAIEHTFAHVKEEMLSLYQPLANQVAEYDRGLTKLTQKNVEKLMEQVDFLHRRYQRSVLEKHDVTVRRIEKIENALFPLGVWQERKLNIFSFAVEHGIGFIDDLIDRPLSPLGKHTIVYL